MYYFYPVPSFKVYCMSICEFVEFHHQLDAAIDVLELIPGVVFADVSEEQMKLFDEQRRTQSSAHSSHMEEFSATKVHRSI